MSTSHPYQAIDAHVDAHFDEQVRFLQELVRVPTDTPPGNNTPHAKRTRELLAAFGFDAEAHEVPEDVVRAHGLQSITNLVVRRRYAQGGRVGAPPCLRLSNPEMGSALSRIASASRRWRGPRQSRLFSGSLSAPAVPAVMMELCR